MNTRSRITLSTLLGLSLAGFCLGSAQAQSGMKHTKAHNEMKHEMREDDELMKDDMMGQPASLSYPYAAPGGLHLYHWSDYAHTRLSSGSAYSTYEDNRWHETKMVHERMRNEDAMMDDTMIEPAPMRYPAGAPGGLDLYHYHTYAREEMVEGSASMKRHDNREMRDKMVNDRIKQEDKMYGVMRQPKAIDYPFAAPGGLHLYHWVDYSGEGLAEGSAAMQRMDNDEKMEKEHHGRMKTNQSPN